MKFCVRSVVLAGLAVLAAGGVKAGVPVIFQQPVSITNILGEPFEFSITADDPVDDPDMFYTYRWKKGGTLLMPDYEAGAWTFTKDASVATDAGGPYVCVVRNIYGQLTSSAGAFLTILFPPTITLQPVSRVIGGGSNVTFSVQVNSALAPTNFTYQWQLDGFDVSDDGFHVSGANSPVLTLTNVTSDDEGAYTVLIANDATLQSVSGNPTVSDEAVLTVVMPPDITFEPDDQIIGVGDAVTFSVLLDPTTTDTPEYPVTYQWRRNGVNINPASNITATNSDYEITASRMADEGIYTVVAKNYGGAVTSTPALLLFLPTITNDPPDLVWPAGSNVTLAFGVAGTAPLRYQWRFNSADVPGQTTNSLTFRVANSNQAGAYTLFVTNALGEVESSAITLTVLPETNPPAITITNPATGARWSNAIVEVRGTATDNGQVNAVRFQVNTDTNLYTANGTNIWVASFPGVPGTNLFTAYAVDGFGNQSTNATRQIFYVVPTPLNLLKSGLGNLTSNWTGGTLEIGRAYTVSGAGTSGFVFSNWTGGTSLPLALLTNSASYTFLMQSNLTLQANFRDVQNPTIATGNTLPTGLRTNADASLFGTAADNDRVAAVRFQLNSGNWFTAAGTNNWTAAVTLATGTNTFRVYAEDATGNRSTTNTLTATATNVAAVNLTIIRTNGQARITFNSVSGATYRLEYKTDLVTNLWTLLPGSRAGNNGSATLTDSNAPAPMRFYRVPVTVP